MHSQQDAAEHHKPKCDRINSIQRVAASESMERGLWTIPSMTIWE